MTNKRYVQFEFPYDDFAVKDNQTNEELWNPKVVDRLNEQDVRIKELESENGEFEVLMISDIEDGQISDNLTKIDVKDNKYDRYLVKENDLIISSKGTRIKIAVVGDIGERKIIANGNLIVLRLDTTKINPLYLEMYFISSLLGSSKSYSNTLKLTSFNLLFADAILPLLCVTKTISFIYNPPKECLLIQVNHLFHK